MELERLKAERSIGEKQEEEEEKELKQLRDYTRQLKEDALSRVEELDKLRSTQREDEKRQREHQVRSPPSHLLPLTPSLSPPPSFLLPRTPSV